MRRNSFEQIQDRLEQGEKIEFTCHQVGQGIMYSGGFHMKKLRVGINGEISIFEYDPKS